jgi:hypothetical protein
MKSDKKPDKNGGAACPVTSKKNHDEESGAETRAGEDGSAEEDPRVVPAKCPFGYDSNTFKLGPLSCMVCQALLHDASKCKPCAHKFCKCVPISSKIRHALRFVSFLPMCALTGLTLAGHAYRASRTARCAVLT